MAPESNPILDVVSSNVDNTEAIKNTDPDILDEARKLKRAWSNEEIDFRYDPKKNKISVSSHQGNFCRIDPYLLATSLTLQHLNDNLAHYLAEFKKEESKLKQDPTLSITAPSNEPSIKIEGISPTREVGVTVADAAAKASVTLEAEEEPIAKVTLEKEEKKEPSVTITHTGQDPALTINPKKGAEETEPTLATQSKKSPVNINIEGTRSDTKIPHIVGKEEGFAAAFGYLLEILMILLMNLPNKYLKDNTERLLKRFIESPEGKEIMNDPKRKDQWIDSLEKIYGKDSPIMALVRNPELGVDQHRDNYYTDNADKHGRISIILPSLATDPQTGRSFEVDEIISNMGLSNLRSEELVGQALSTGQSPAVERKQDLRSDQALEDAAEKRNSTPTTRKSVRLKPS
jgi:hypothetical protein